MRAESNRTQISLGVMRKNMAGDRVLWLLYEVLCGCRRKMVSFFLRGIHLAGDQSTLGGKKNGLNYSNKDKITTARAVAHLESRRPKTGVLGNTNAGNPRNSPNCSNMCPLEQMQATRNRITKNRYSVFIKKMFRGNICPAS